MSVKNLNKSEIFLSENSRLTGTMFEQFCSNHILFLFSKSLSPITRDDIREWFITSEIPYSSFRSSNGQIYPWFHGIISRPYAEQILCRQLVGSYLIRISEKIFGYVLSYHASDHCRHLLIEVIYPEHTYRFVGGAKKESFATLTQLIKKYSVGNK